jgi:twitching motility two-component system response regulator PilH
METILIADDSPTEAAAMSSWLERRGFRTLLATTGREAVSSAREHLPALILMDVIMPGMNGFQATRRLARDPTTCDIPVVLVTSKDQETDRIWGLRQGASRYLTKPLSELDLLDTIQDLLSAGSASSNA